MFTVTCNIFISSQTRHSFLSSVKMIILPWLFILFTTTCLVQAETALQKRQWQSRRQGQSRTPWKGSGCESRPPPPPEFSRMTLEEIISAIKLMPKDEQADMLVCPCMLSMVGDVGHQPAPRWTLSSKHPQDLSIRKTNQESAVVANGEPIPLMGLLPRYGV